jgi:hypothetical protein
MRRPPLVLFYEARASLRNEPFIHQMLPELKVLFTEAGDFQT